MKLLDPKRLRHIEGFSEKRMEQIKKKILKEGVWTRPLCIESKHLLVLDGQHRMEIALSLGLARVPCQLFEYKDVEVWSLRHNHEVSRELVVEKVLSEDLYPYKTAKHRFPGEIEKISIPLEQLYEK